MDQKASAQLTCLIVHLQKKIDAGVQWQGGLTSEFMVNGGLVQSSLMEGTVYRLVGVLVSQVS